MRTKRALINDQFHNELKRDEHPIYTYERRVLVSRLQSYHMLKTLV